MSQAIVSRAQWLTARLELLEAEKALNAQRDALAAQRRALPWVQVKQDYRFDSEQGEVGLVDLFDGHSQLLVYHFMFGPDWQAGCPSCSFWADGYNGILEHLAARDTALVAVSTAPLPQLLAYRERMGWRFPWVSCAGNSFNQDYGVTFTDQQVASGAVPYNYGQRPFPGNEAPGLSVFHRPDEETVVHTYSCYARGLDPFNSAYQLLDLTPNGRNEADLPYPMAWVQRRDEYGGG